MSGEATTRETPPVKKREWIADLLEQVPIVEWDRFAVAERDGYQFVDVYGWIERDQDDYKDFVVARFWPATEFVEYTTSSEKFTELLQVEWFGEDSLGEHNPCHRVEHTFDVDNAIELGENE